MSALSIATKIIAEFEGFRSAPYQDTGGVYTIGFGFTVDPNGKHVSADTPHISQEDATDRLSLMVDRVLTRVREIAHVPLTDNQAAALTSFAYNLGTNALTNSTLMRLLNEGKPAEAAAQFPAWCHVNGAVCPGVLRRRRAEAALFLTPDVVEVSA